jgi:arsenic resistance protein ArsH
MVPYAIGHTRVWWPKRRLALCAFRGGTAHIRIAADNHPAVRELRELSMWSEGQVWCSPERHDPITGVMKAQIDHLPLNMGGVRPTQGRTLAVMQVSGGSQSFNAGQYSAAARPLDAHVHFPNQSSVPKAFQEFDATGPMNPSSYYDRRCDGGARSMHFTAAASL